MLSFYNVFWLQFGNIWWMVTWLKLETFTETLFEVSKCCWSGNTKLSPWSNWVASVSYRKLVFHLQRWLWASCTKYTAKISGNWSALIKFLLFAVYFFIAEMKTEMNTLDAYLLNIFNITYIFCCFVVWVNPFLCFFMSTI